MFQVEEDVLEELSRDHGARRNLLDLERSVVGLLGEMEERLKGVFGFL